MDDTDKITAIAITINDLKDSGGTMNPLGEITNWDGDIKRYHIKRKTIG